MIAQGLSLLLLVASAQTIPNEPFVRSKTQTDSSQPIEHCLYWTATTITMHQNSRGSAEVEGESEFTAISKSWSDWQVVQNQCGSLTMVEGPRVSDREVGFDPRSADNRNIVVFRDKNCTAAAPARDSCFADGTCGNDFDCWQYGSGTIALTTSSYDPRNGQVFDSDVELNDGQYYFTATTGTLPECPAGADSQACVATDVQNAMTHEFGHLLGLDHTSRAGSTMNDKATDGETYKRNIDQGSSDFVCTAYPKGKLARDCVIEQTPQALGDEQGCNSAGPASLASVGLGLGALLFLRRRREGRDRQP